MDLNQRPSGYEPDELPGCSIPHSQTRSKLAGCNWIFGVSSRSEPGRGTRRPPEAWRRPHGKSHGCRSWRWLLHCPRPACGRVRPRFATRQVPFPLLASGACPRSGVKSATRAFLLVGLGASGQAARPQPGTPDPAFADHNPSKTGTYPKHHERRRNYTKRETAPLGRFYGHPGCRRRLCPAGRHL